MIEGLVSVVVPVHNNERYVAEALNSVLAQSYQRLELIVVDDGSTDASAQQIQSIHDPRLRYVFQPHRGAGAARNQGVTHATGEYLSFLDSDDVWPPDKLMVQVSTLVERIDLDIIFGYHVDFISPELNKGTRLEMEPKPGYSSGTMLVRRTSFDRVGLFSNEWRVGEFIDWYARAVDAGCQVELLPQVLLNRRIHQTNTGVQQRDARTDYARVISAIVQRRQGKSAQQKP